MFPTDRPRRMRVNPAMRRLVAETEVRPRHLVLPVFVAEGADVPRPIARRNRTILMEFVGYAPAEPAPQLKDAWMDHQEARRLFDETLVTHSAFAYDAGRQAARVLLDRPDRPTAIFAANDEIALGVMEEARRRSIRIPEDLSVVGFDDAFLASRSAPPLTTVAQPLLEMGRVATRSLAQMISNDVVGTRHIELATRLVVRDSTARLDG